MSRYIVTSHTKERFVEEAIRQHDASQGMIGGDSDRMEVTTREIPDDELSIHRQARRGSHDPSLPEERIDLQFIVVAPHHMGGFATHEDDHLSFNFVAVITEESDEVHLNIIS